MLAHVRRGPTSGEFLDTKWVRNKRNSATGAQLRLRSHGDFNMDSMPNSTGNQSCLDTALLALDLGLSPLPPLEDGSKAPLFELINGEWTWKPYQTTPATAEHVHQWYAGGLTGVGLACGVDDLECLDFDNPDTYKDYLEAAWATGLNDLVLRIRAGYEEWTPSGGCIGFIGVPSERATRSLLSGLIRKP